MPTHKEVLDWVTRDMKQIRHEYAESEDEYKLLGDTHEADKCNNVVSVLNEVIRRAELWEKQVSP